MSTDTNTPVSVPVVPDPTPAPTNPAKGSRRGQTTQAAKLDRWESLVNNLLPHIDQLPGLQDSFAQFQGMVLTVKTLRNRLKVLRADTGDVLTQRNQIFVDGDDLYTRLSLVLQGVHGPQNDRLREFGIKPRRKPVPQKTPISSLVSAPELAAPPAGEKNPAK
jgi:hypothetical protein